METCVRVLFWIAAVIAGGILTYAGGLLLLATLTEFSPPPHGPLSITGRAGVLPDTVTHFSVLTWNIGYGGLDSEMDFFYDGGKRVRPGLTVFRQTWSGILGFLKEHDSVDFILLQEVDSGARRSYFTDEVTGAGSAFPVFSRTYAENYNCRFVPVPLTGPMGSVISGMVTCSRYQPASAYRYGFDSRGAWPGRLFYMKRCFMVSRFPAGKGKELIIVNIHNSAYDPGGMLRRREMEMIGKVLKDEYAAGNWVVAGGDWNTNPPGFKPDAVTTGDLAREEEFLDLTPYFPGWTYVHDPNTPTNRRVDQSYRKGITPVTTIDFFLVSPNIRVLHVHTFNTDFAESDHQPVLLEFTLSPSV